MVRYKFVHFNKRSDFDSYVPNPESNSANGNEYYNYVVFIKDTKEIYTHGQFYNCSDSGDSSIDEILEELKSSINSKADLSSLEALIKEVEENEEVTAAALTELHENKADKSEIPDVSAFATKDELNTLSAEVEEKVDSTIFTTLSETVAGHTTNINNLSDNKADKTDLEDYAKKDDLNTKQDQLVSGEDIKTINGNSILGSGNIEIPDTKVTSASNHYGYNENNATSTTGAFVTKITKDAANHVTSFESRALVETDIPGLDASKITTGEISIDRLPKGALERLFVVESEAAAISATVQEGDVVQVTGNSNKMYFCISNTATTFATKFKEFTAGTATSVPWSGMTGKPTGIDGWGDRIGVIESGYATQSWVGENYLSKNGGTLADALTVKGSGSPLTVHRTQPLASVVKFVNTDGDLGWLGVDIDKTAIFMEASGVIKKLLHSGNYSDYALSINGGNLSGQLSISTNGWGNQLVLNGVDSNAGIEFRYSNTYVAALSCAQNNPYWHIGETAYPILHSGNYADYALSITGGRISGDLKLTSREVGNDNAHSGKLIFAGANNDYGNNDYKMGPYIQAINVGGWGKKKISFFQRDCSVEGFDADPEEVFSIMPNGNILIGSTEDSGEKLQVNGNVKANNFIGSLTGTADRAFTQAVLYGDRDVNLWDTDASAARYFALADTASNTPSGVYALGSILMEYSWGTNAGAQLLSNNAGNNIFYRSRWNGAFKDWREIACTDSNVASATKLQTPRTIWGRFFDGTDDVNGTLYGVNFIRNYNSNEIIYEDTIDGDVYVGCSSFAKARVLINANGRLVLTESGNVAIGGTTADEKLHVYGNVKASGSMYAVDFATTSDNRLKDFVSDIYVDFESIKQIPKKYYYWKDKSMGEDLQIGTSAQELAKIYPECVHYDETNDRYSVNYQKLSIVALAAIDKLHDRVSELESKLYDKNN